MIGARIREPQHSRRPRLAALLLALFLMLFGLPALADGTSRLAQSADSEESVEELTGDVDTSDDTPVNQAETSESADSQSESSHPFGRYTATLYRGHR